MKKNATSAFTLIEMLTVMVIIAVIASLVVAVSGVVNAKAARNRAEGEIQAITVACESYKADNGSYPRNDETDKLDPRTDGEPSRGKYKDANLHLYRELSGDKLPEDAPDGKPESDSKYYYPFQPNVLSADKDASSGKITKVKYFQDPFGQPYGYSTGAAEEEEDFLKELRKKPNATRKISKGYNTASFDMWSTGGTSSNKTGGTNGGSSGEVDQARWIKNW